MATLETVYRVDSSDLKRAQVDLRNFEKVNIRTFQSAVGHMKRMANTSDYAFNQLGRAATRAQVRTKRFASVGLQQVGYQVGDFAVQLQGGTNAAVAFGQQGSQLLGIFGPLGAILGAVLAIMTAFAAPLLDSAEGASKMSEQMDQLRSKLEPIEPLLRSIRNAFVQLREFAIDAVNTVLNNLDRVVTYAATIATFFATKWVAGMVAARVAVLGFSGSLIALGSTIQAVLIRSFFGIALVALAEGVLQFIRLIKVTGSFGKALDQLAAVASAAWNEIGQGALALGLRLQAVALDIAGNFLRAFDQILVGWGRLLDKFTLGTGLMNSALEAFGSDFRIKIMEGFAENSGLGAMADSLTGRATAAYGRANQIPTGFQDTKEAVSNLMDLLKEANDTGKNIDIREWFKNVDKIKEAEDATGALGDKLQEVADGPLDKYRKKLEEALDPEKNYVTSMKALQSSLADFIFDPFDKGVKGMVLSFSNALRRMASEAIAAKIMQSIVGPVGSGASGGIGGAFASFLGMANGGAFSQGRVTPFASGGVVNGPTVFPMANGMGLMGEAGPEAVMPLKRDKSGRLGVEAQGAQMEAPQIKVVNIDDRASIGDYLESPDGEKIVVNVLRRNGIVSR